MKYLAFSLPVVEETILQLHQNVFYNTLKKWRYISPLIILFIFPSAHSYNLQQENLSSYLSSQDIVQDKSGYIWFAGQTGLSRFDGENIINFFGQSSQWKIPFTWVNDITLTEDHFLTSTESHGLWLFFPKTGKSLKLNINLPDKAIYSSIKFKNKYYLNIPNEMYVYSPSQEKTSLLSKNMSISFFEKTQDNLYAAGRDGLYKLIDNEFSLITKENIQKIIAVKQGVLAVTSHTLYYFGDNGTYKEIPNTKHLNMGAKTNDGNFILLNKAGNIFKLSAPNLKELKHDYPGTEPLIAKEIIQDSSNTLWITSNKGIKKVYSSPIKNHPKIYNVATNASEVELFNNKIIVGSYGGGIHILNDTSSTISSEINPYLTNLAKRTMDLLAIDDNLYIATFDGLWAYNRSSKNVKRVNFKNNNKLLLKITKSQHLLYIATNYDGFYIYDLLTKRIVEHIDVDKGISSSEIIDILPLNNYKIWLATPKGIDIYNRYTKTNQRISVPAKSKVISFTVFNNKVYAATKGDGIFILNFHGELLSQMGNGNDFSTISTINNQVWAPAKQGLYRISTDNTMTLVPNTEQYAFTDRPIRHKDKVYIPHYGGMLEVPLTDIKKYNSVVSISEITVSGNTYLTNDSIEVNSENDVISFNLASLDYRSGKSKKYQYQINNGDWHHIYGNQLTLTGLRSGTYKLAIKGTNSLGQWSSHQAFSEIHVAYPWYSTPQMKILYVVALLFLLIAVAWLLYLRFNSIKHIHSLLANDLKKHSKITFNVERNLMKARELLSEKFESFTPEQLYHVSQMINESLHALSHTDNEAEPNSIQGKTLEVALPYFIKYTNEKYHSNILLKIEILEDRLSQEMQADVYKIIYETIISTIVNGSGNHFEITIQEFKQKLWLTISNDGNGFSKFKNKINFDMSMYYIRQIASKYNASFNVFDKEGSGSQLIISIPLMDIY